MLCNEVVKGEQGYLCGYQDKVFVCKQCNGNQCEGCEELPKPQFIQPQSYQGMEDYEGFNLGAITNWIKDKKFLAGVGVGLAIGFFFFRKK